MTRLSSEQPIKPDKLRFGQLLKSDQVLILLIVTNLPVARTNTPKALTNATTSKATSRWPKKANETWSRNKLKWLLSAKKPASV
jgi:hypothetical protein